VTDLGFIGNQAIEWEEYTNKLKVARICITEREDRMIWDGKYKKK